MVTVPCHRWESKVKDGFRFGDSWSFTSRVQAPWTNCFFSVGHLLFSYLSRLAFLDHFFFALFLWYSHQEPLEGRDCHYCFILQNSTCNHVTHTFISKRVMQRCCMPGLFIIGLNKYTDILISSALISVLSLNAPWVCRYNGNLCCQAPWFQFLSSIFHFSPESQL